MYIVLATVDLSCEDPNIPVNPSALSVSITSGPSSGVLYQTWDGVSLGAVITTFPSAVTSPTFTVIYVNTEPTTDYDGLPTLYQDSFQYVASVTYYSTLVPANVAGE